jgi:hypothetical protein
MHDVAANISEFRAPRTGHWIAEENAAGCRERLLAFLYTFAV